MTEFRFGDPENLGVFVCNHVRLQGQPILQVLQDEDGAWQFLCGGEHAQDGGEGLAIVCLLEVVKGDPSLNELAGVCRLTEAERASAAEPWRFHSVSRN